MVIARIGRPANDAGGNQRVAQSVEWPAVLVLHTLWSAAGALFVWAEDSLAPSEAPRRRGRAPKVPKPRPHPFSAAPGALVDVLTRSGPQLGDPARKAIRRELAVLLPSAPAGPLASPDLVREPSALDATGDPTAGAPAVTPIPWLVAGIEFDPGLALDVLDTLGQGRSAVEDPDELPPLSASTRFFASLASFAVDLVSRGRVLPGLVEEGDGYAARWRPVLAGEDAAVMRAFAGVMPPACRAEYLAEAATGGRSSGEVLGGAVNGLADAAVRAALAGRPTETRARAYSLLPPRRGRRPATVATAETWVEALTAAEPQVRATPAEIDELREALTTWHRSGAATTGPVRTCFRLAAPPERDADEDLHAPGDDPHEQPWRLEFLMQATDDPSLIVTAAELWQGAASFAPLTRLVEHPQEVLLADLGRASRLYPELDGALRTAAPTALELDAAAAHGFLRTAAPMLDQAGFGVQLPSWWTEPSARLGLRLTATGAASEPSAVARLGEDALLDYRWDLALGDEQLSEAELAELARLKVPLVRLRGKWVELDSDRLAAGLKFLERNGTGRMRPEEVLRAGLLPTEADHGLPVMAVGADGWLGDLLSGQAEQRLRPVAAPAGFGATLRPYQERGLAWLSFFSQVGLGACLADDMGLGKTAQLLALLASEKTQRTVSGRPTLLVCPMSVVGNWQREAARFAPMLTVHVHHGSDRLTGDELIHAMGETDLVITTYALATRDADTLAGMQWRRVALDEAQNIKNSAAKQSRAVRRIPAEHRVALTGTPVENRLSELWSILDFVNPGLLGTASAFRSRFAVPIERHGEAEAAELLKRVSGPFVLRRLKTDSSIISDLPDKFEMKVLCNLTVEQASLYQAVVDDMLARISDSDGMSRKGLVLATMTKLKQVCNHPAQLLHDGSRFAARSGKLARLEEILEEVLADGDKALCFTQFAEFGSMLRAHLSGRFGHDVLYLHGGTPKRERDAMVARFQESDRPAIFLLSLKAGGTGLNLTAANHVIHVDRWWNPAVEDQATDRAFRIGQRKDVQVRKFVCVGTLEERIDAMIEEKKALAERIVGTGENWLTELSVAELREVVALSADAVSE